MKKLIGILYSIALLTILLGIHNGQIAVWKDDDPQPFLILPYKADMLPVKDRIALNKGIRFDSFQDLEQILQDYLT